MDLGPDCIGYQQDVEMQTVAIAKASCPKIGGGFTPVTRLKFKRLSPLDFKNSCLAEGTRVLRADGTSAPVESINVGDKVLASAGGRALTVTTVSKGVESKPMVRLKDAKGRDVMVTRNHPMVSRTRGVVAAESLQAGDVVLARDGEATLTSVERVPYDGRVYNLTLGTAQELEQVGSQERTLFANGFMVGDNQMQTDLERQKVKTAPADVLAQLHPAWHADYRHEQARKAARK